MNSYVGNVVYNLITRLYSNRMRTAHSLPYKGGGLCPGRGASVQEGGSLSRKGILCPGRGVSVQGSLLRGVLCPGESLPEGNSVQGVSVQRGVSVWGSLSRKGGSLSKKRILCPGIGSLSRKGGLSPGRGVSVQEGGSLSRKGGLCPGRVSMQGVSV